MPSECRQRPRSAYKTPFRIGRRGQHNPVHFISARFACGLEHGTLAAALRQELLRKSFALAACIGGRTASLGGPQRQEHWRVDGTFYNSWHPVALPPSPAFRFVRRSLKNLHTLRNAAAKMKSCSNAERVQAKTAIGVQNSIPDRSQRAAQPGAFYICALRLRP